MQLDLLPSRAVATSIAEARRLAAKGHVVRYAGLEARLEAGWLVFDGAATDVIIDGTITTTSVRGVA